MSELEYLKAIERLEELKKLTQFQINIQRVYRKFLHELHSINEKQSLQNP